MTEQESTIKRETKIKKKEKEDSTLLYHHSPSTTSITFSVEIFTPVFPLALFVHIVHSNCQDTLKNPEHMTSKYNWSCFCASCFRMPVYKFFFITNGVLYS